MTQADEANEGREGIKKAPNQRCSLDGEKVIPCFIMDGDGCVDYSGRCFGCGDKMVITTDEQNQTEYDAARAYLIKEGLDPDQLAKEGTVFIKAIHEQISLRDQLSKEREMRKDELKQAFNAGRNYQRGEMGVWHGAPDHDYPDFKQWYESLIAKATELDKK